MTTEQIQNLYDDTYTRPRYRYGYLYRPFGFYHQPKGFIIGSYRQLDRYFRYGTIDYPRELTTEETEQYQLKKTEIE